MMTRHTSIGLLLLRLAFGLLMFFHGFAKMMPGGLAGIKGLMESLNMPTFFAYAVLIGEVIAPIMIIIGYRTRVAGFLFAFSMIVAIFSAHSGDLLSLSNTGGYALELQVLYLIGGFALMFTGAGKYAVSTRSRWD